MSDTITVFEVGPRDGLQSLGAHVATQTKIALIDALTRAGLRKIEATSFVSPRWVPQMADAAAVMAGINRQDGVTYAALTPNERGLDQALAAGCDEIAVFASASEGFSRANLNCSIEDSFARFAPVMARSAQAGLPVRGYLSTVIACPFDGPTPPSQVRHWAQRLLEIGCYEVSLGDTIGAGTPDTLADLLQTLLQDIPGTQLAGHFHDTSGRAGELVSCALDLGLRTFDASVAGLGGCPYAPGAPGNIDTRKLLDLASARGFTHGVDLSLLKEAERIASSILGH
tara:strand:+ start:866 stop:1720 length:855 start_codon:yes stop_codon:yes gene_type:complete